MKNKIFYIIVFLFIIIICIGICIFLLKDKNIENKKETDKEEIKKEMQTENTRNLSFENIETEGIEENMIDRIKLIVNEKELIMKLDENDATKELVEKLKQGDIVVNAKDYGSFEKVGNLGFNLKTSDTDITTEACDVMLYMGNQVTIFYDSNTWSYTRLGKIEGVSKEELKEILGVGNTSITFSLIN